MAAPPRVRLLAAAAACTVVGLVVLSWSAYGSPENPDLWLTVGVVLLAASGLLHWRASSASG